MGNFLNDSQQNEMISLPNALAPSVASTAMRCQGRNIIKYETKRRNDDLPAIYSTVRSSPQFALPSPHLLLQPHFHLHRHLQLHLHLAIYLSGRQAHMRVLWPARRSSPSSVSVLFSFCFLFLFLYLFLFFACSQAQSTVRILALCKSFPCPRPSLTYTLLMPSEAHKWR